MSKPRIKILLEVDTFAHAETIVNSVQNRVVGKDIFEVHQLKAFINDDNQKPGVLTEFRFNSRVDRDDLTDWIKSQIQNHPQVKNWVISASVSTHLCTHDDPQVFDCLTTEYIEWKK